MTNHQTCYFVKTYLLAFLFKSISIISTFYIVCTVFLSKLFKVFETLIYSIYKYDSNIFFYALSNKITYHDCL